MFGIEAHQGTYGNGGVNSAPFQKGFNSNMEYYKAYAIDKNNNVYMIYRPDSSNYRLCKFKDGNLIESITIDNRWATFYDGQLYYQGYSKQILDKNGTLIKNLTSLNLQGNFSSYRSEDKTIVTNDNPYATGDTMRIYSDTGTLLSSKTFSGAGQYNFLDSVIINKAKSFITIGYDVYGRIYELWVIKVNSTYVNSYSRYTNGNSILINDVTSL